MKSVILGICFALAGLGRTAPDRRVVICFDRVGQTAAAESIASEIFAGIGVELQWRHCQSCPAGGIRVRMSMNTPPPLIPGALAYATPYGEAGVRVFQDRVLGTVGGNRELAAALLGHVLAHEIGHVLQGVSRHSEAGVMKARWEFRDVLDMSRKAFSFTPVDEDLIAHGMEARNADRAPKIATQ